MKYPRLRDLREDKDQNQIDIANMLNLGLSTYQRYEQGKLKIYLETAHELADYYNVSLDYIAGRTNDKRGLTRSELSEADTDILKKIHALSDEQRGIIIGRIEAMTEENEEKQAKLKGAV